MKILGVSCFYHDSAVALLVNGDIVAAAQEERFTRKKHDARFPISAITYCLKEVGIHAKDIDIIAFYDKPFVKFERILETHIAEAPRGLPSFLLSMPIWLKEKLWVEDEIRHALPEFKGKIVYSSHHESHAASAFFPSPFEKAGILTVDGVGEWATTTIGIGDGNTILLTKEMHFPHSLGLFYSAFTYYLGFKVNSGEYKVMGLAPYGKPLYTDIIYQHLIDVKEDGSFQLNMDYFDYAAGLRMVGDRFISLFGFSVRERETELEQKHMDIAASLQKVTEDIMLKLALHTKEVSGSKNLCLSGGVALNCVANGVISRSSVFDRIWVQPAAGDAGSALGAAYVAWHSYLGHERLVPKGGDLQKGSLLGPSYASKEIQVWLANKNIPATRLTQENRAHCIAELLAEGKVIGLFSGRMEFGPRALGARSIIADARNPEMQSKLNLKIKFRESFRPFAPSVLSERAREWFELSDESPYMLLTADVISEKRSRISTEDAKKWGIELLKVPRSSIPAVTHVDYSARVQTVDAKRAPDYHRIIEAFNALTGCPVIVNTSFNVRGEPIVESPEDAYRCFMRTDMDYLILEDFLLQKDAQPKSARDDAWEKDYELD